MPYLAWTIIYYFYSRRCRTRFRKRRLPLPRSGVFTNARLHYFLHLLYTGYYHLHYLIVIMGFRPVPVVLMARAAWRAAHGRPRALVAPAFEVLAPWASALEPGPRPTRTSRTRGHPPSARTYASPLTPLTRRGHCVGIHLDAVHGPIRRPHRACDPLDASRGPAAFNDGIGSRFLHHVPVSGLSGWSPPGPTTPGAILSVYLLVFLLTPRRGGHSARP